MALTHNLLVEKIMDKLGNKYEALVRMSIIARRLTDGNGPVQMGPNDKVTLVAMDEFLKAHDPSRQTPPAGKK
jgi:DNA-directed RNA polymerase subunit K/omega